MLKNLHKLVRYLYYLFDIKKFTINSHKSVIMIVEPVNVKVEMGENEER